MSQELDIPPSPTFHWADYLVLGLFLLSTTLIGVFIGWLDRRKTTSAEFLLGGGDMHYIPVGLSIQASFLSSIFLISTPTEFYNYGTAYAYLALSYYTAMPIAAYMFMPTFKKLRLTSAYEYLERRFNRAVRIAGSLTFAVMIILYMAVVLYTPSLALAQVTGISVAVSICVCGVVCVIYTVLGGMKATIWNDFFQMIIILASMLSLIVVGGIEAGTNIWATCEEGGRIKFDNFNPDPTERMTFWTQTVGGTFVTLAQYASAQTVIQKFLTVKKLENAQKAMWVAAVSSTVCMVLAMALGLVMYAYYAHCDPISVGRIEKSDQLVPLFLMDVMGDLPGMPGLFLSGAFSAALSSLSGSLNAMAAVVLLDFIRPAYWKLRKKDISDRNCALGFGIVTIVLGFAAQYFGDLVLQIALSIFGFIGGPLTAVLSLGLFFPFVNSWGALSGLLVSLGISCWIAIGTIVEGLPPEKLIMQIDGCPMRNVTDNYTSTDNNYYYYSTTGEFMQSTVQQEPESVLWVYQISYMWYSLMAMVIAIVVAVPVSLITGYAKDTDERLTYQWADNCCCYCPAPYKHCLRCGAKHYEHDDEDEHQADDIICKTVSGDDGDVAGDTLKHKDDLTTVDKCCDNTAFDEKFHFDSTDVATTPEQKLQNGDVNYSTVASTTNDVGDVQDRNSSSSSSGGLRQSNGGSMRRKRRGLAVAEDGRASPDYETDF